MSPSSPDFFEPLDLFLPVLPRELGLAEAWLAHVSWGKRRPGRDEGLM